MPSNRETDDDDKRVYVTASFSLENLFSELKNDECLRTPNDTGIVYLYRYLRELDCQVMAIENQYVDRDYLNDYSVYYVKCFKPYDRFCKRIHFFTRLDDKRFRTYLAGKCDDLRDLTREMNEAYLGYVVVKPLPSAIIGRSVLMPPMDAVVTGEDESRKISIRCIREYKPSLAGIRLSVRGLGFQEQDKVLAACATSALWSAFQRTTVMFDHIQPNLFDITIGANKFFQMTRPIPSEGLTPNQMCQAIRNVGLEPEHREIYGVARRHEDTHGTSDYQEEAGESGDEEAWEGGDVIRIVFKYPLLSAGYGYLRGGIPIVLTSRLRGLDDLDSYHAVTLVGYEIDKTGPEVDEGSLYERASRISLVGSRIVKFFVHDDQIGPYSELTVQSTKTTTGQQVIELSSDYWTTTVGSPVTFFPDSMTIPLYHKIRVPFISPLRLATRMNQPLVHAIDGADIEWDIFLASVNEYKEEVAERGDIIPEIKEGILGVSLPRFIWRTRAFTKGQEVCEMLIDATDMERSFQMFHLNVFDDGLRENLRDIPDYITKLLNSDPQGYGRFLLRSISESLQ